MSAAELPERRPVDADGTELRSAAPAEAPSPGSARSDGSLERLQARLDELRVRIHEALPEGYDLEELIKASGEGHETEDVFDITGELEALERLSGPVIVPGMTPPPAFDDDRMMPETGLEDAAGLPSPQAGRRWLWIALAVAVVVAAVVAAAVLLGYL